MEQPRERIFWLFSYNRCTVWMQAFSSPKAFSTPERKIRPYSLSTTLPFRCSKRGTPSSPSSRAMERLRLGWVTNSSRAAWEIFPVRATVRK